MHQDVLAHQEAEQAKKDAEMQAQIENQEQADIETVVE
jgi:hypothetical protein